MLAVAIGMHRAGRIGEAPAEPAEAWLRIPFSLYVGWLVIATFINVSTELARIGWDGFGWSPVTWGILMIVASSIIGLITRFRLDDPVVGTVFVWAYLAIVVQQQERPLVSLFAGLAAALCLLSLFVRDRHPARSRHHSECAEV
jgi:predicted membrane channel-forming protein YqfA (hemolysin III family)